MTAILPARTARRRRGSRASGRAGFTLIEVLIALVVLSTGIVIVLQAFQTSVSALGEARDAMRAAHLLQGKLQELGTMSPRQPALSGTGSFPEPFDMFLWQVTPAPAAARAEGLEQIRLEVWHANSRVRYAVTTQRWDGETE